MKREKQMSERRVVVVVVAEEEEEEEEEGARGESGFGAESAGEGLIGFTATSRNGKRRKTTPTGSDGDEVDQNVELNRELVMWGEDEVDIQIGEETVNQLMKVLEQELHFNNNTTPHFSISRATAADGESCGSSFSNPACTLMAGMNIATIYPCILLNQQEVERREREAVMASDLASTHGINHFHVDDLGVGGGVGVGGAEYQSNQGVEENEDDDAWLERVLSGSLSFYFDEDDQAPILLTPLQMVHGE